MNNQLQVADEAHKTHKKLLKLKNELTYDFLCLGELLFNIKEKKFYEILDYQTFSSYLGSPEISISLSTTYALIDIYDRFLLQFKINQDRLLPIGRTKLERILPIIDEKNYEEWLEKAEYLSTSDLDKELKQFKNKKVFEYKYTKNAKLSFTGDTKMEYLLEKQLNLIEWHCEKCDNYFWTTKFKLPIECPYCKAQPSENGEITYKQLKEK